MTEALHPSTVGGRRGDSEPIAALDGGGHPTPLASARETGGEYLVHDVPLFGSVYAVTEKGGS
ncbi:hypothetical protein [Micromonospora echinaurantiaca]|uniref:hypothetical protein n=1 Tax=Micromonospora echinaurantiaca TaxID=47857 RepID=UPI00343BC1E0